MRAEYGTCPSCGHSDLNPATEKSRKDFLHFFPNFFKEKQFCPTCKKEIQNV